MISRYNAQACYCNNDNATKTHKLNYTVKTEEQIMAKSSSLPQNPKS